MKKINKKSNKGFTLVELIVVIAILAVLAVGAVLAYQNIAAQATQAALRADAISVAKALNLYNGFAETKITDTTHVGVLAVDRAATLELNLGGNLKMDISVTVASGNRAAVAGYLTYTATGGWQVEDIPAAP